MVKTNQSFLNPDCTPITGAAATILSLIPIFFSLAIFAMGVGMAYSALSSAGMLGSEVSYSTSKKKSKKKGKKSGWFKTLPKK
jgi:phosphoribosyl-AMP cyclohydrolase